MPDAWETAHGFNQTDPMTLTDLDEEHVPNLWEHTRGSDPSNPNDMPAWDAVVDGSLIASDPTQNQYKNLQEAYDSLPGGAYRSMVRIKLSYYHGGWSGEIIPKKVAWIVSLSATASSVRRFVHQPPSVVSAARHVRIN